MKSENTEIEKCTAEATLPTYTAGSGTTTARDKISKSRVAAVKRSRKRGHNWRLVALLHSRRIDRAPEDPGVASCA